MSIDEEVTIINHKEIEEAVNLHIKAMGPDDTAALFLLSAETGEKWKPVDGIFPEHVLSRFFGKDALISQLKDDRYLIFMRGNITEKLAEEKARLLCSAFMPDAEDQSFDIRLKDCIGICLISGPGQTFAAALRGAEYAARLAKARKTEYYIFQAARSDHFLSFGPGEPVLSQFPPADPDNADTASLKFLSSQFALCQEWLEFVLSRSDLLLWDVDIKAKQFRMFSCDRKSLSLFGVYDNFPESLIANGRIHEDSAIRFRAFAKNMLEGREEDTGSFIVRNRKTNVYSWCSMSYRLLYDEEGRPARALGTKQVLSDFSAGRARTVRRRPAPESLYPHLYCYVQANLTLDLTEQLQTNGSHRTGREAYRQYSRLLEDGILDTLSRDDRAVIREEFGTSALLNRFALGQRWLVRRVRFTDSQNRIRRGLVGANLCRDAETGDIILFVYVCTMEERWKWESQFPFSIVKRSAADLLTKDAVRAAAQHLLKQENGRMCALALIRLDGFQEAFGSEEDAQKRKDIMSAFFVFLGVDGFCGRLSEDSLAVFFPDVQSRNMIEKKLKTTLTSVRLSLEGIPELDSLRFITGICCREISGADYDKMLEEADALCRLHNTEASDTVLLPGRALSAPESAALRETVMTADELQPVSADEQLTEQEKDVAIECMDLLLRQSGDPQTTDQVLEKLGVFYQAERTYVLAFSRRDQSAVILHEWGQDGRPHLHSAFFGKHLKDFPLFIRCFKTMEPVLLSRKESDPVYAGPDRPSSWGYIVFPMAGTEEFHRFFCMENPEMPFQDMSLLKKILSYLRDDRQKEPRNLLSDGMDNSLLQLPNLKSYMDAVYSLDSNLYSTMGALTIDYPRNTEDSARKAEQNSRFELRLSEVLTDVFGKSMLFHPQKAEFVVLSVDTAYEAFVTRCDRVRNLLSQQYAGQFRIGFTWSDGVFNAEDLVKRARMLMCCDTSGSALANKRLMENNLHSWEFKAAQSVKFTIYLQPKFDMRTGVPVGAEALVRMMDSEGKLLPHGKIIDHMEKEGNIQELDYFVFDRTLSLLSKWKQSGCRLLPISTNFSRKTILNPSALASLMAISSRYPEIPLDMVEMEITETAGDFEGDTFSRLIDRFDKYGFQFPLDDFGARYSNLSMLANVHFHSVKLDRSIIRGIDENLVSQMMVENIVNICRNMGMTCIAEGVETQEQAAALLKVGCVYCQGYFYGHPVPIQEFEELYLSGFH